MLKKMAKMKIATRMMVAFIAAVIISSIAGVVGIVLLKMSDSGYSYALVNYGFAQGDIGNLGRHFQSQRVNTVYIVLGSDESIVDSMEDTLQELDAGINADMEKVSSGMVSELGRQVYGTLVTAMDEYRVVRAEAVTARKTSKELAEKILNEKVSPASTAVSTIIDTMLTDKTRIGDEESVVLSNNAQMFIWIMVGIMLIGCSLAIILAVITAKSVSRPITLCAERLKLLSVGDLDAPVPTSTMHDETGDMMNSLGETVMRLNDVVKDVSYNLAELSKGNLTTEVSMEYQGSFVPVQRAIERITASLNDAMGQINQASDEVSSGSEQVSSGAQELSQGATEQASAVEELAATITEISQQVKENAGNAVDASRLAGTVGNSIFESNNKMQELIKAMTEISSSSSEIAKIIKTIEDIAFQTNILALNAAVEAARAGAAGKGFAVVADEVRNLAGKSAQAAKNTTALIEGSIKAVENGTKLADVTAKSLTDVVSGAHEVVDTIDKISKASNEQASSISQVTQGVDQISSVVQTNSATAEQSAAASEELSGQAQMLKSLVARFKLKGN